MSETSDTQSVYREATCKIEEMNNYSCHDNTIASTAECPNEEEIRDFGCHDNTIVNAPDFPKEEEIRDSGCYNNTIASAPDFLNEEIRDSGCHDNTIASAPDCPKEEEIRDSGCHDNISASVSGCCREITMKDPSYYDKTSRPNSATVSFEEKLKNPSCHDNKCVTGFCDISQNTGYAEDNYNHPSPGLVYVETSFPGVGIDEKLFNSVPEGCKCGSKCEKGSCNCMKRSHWGQNTQSPWDYPTFECNSDCTCNLSCPIRLTQRGPRQGLDIVPVGPNAAKGLGVITREHIPSGAFVCEYAGEIIGEEEAKRRMKATPDHEPNYILVIREHLTPSSDENTVPTAHECMAAVPTMHKHTESTIQKSAAPTIQDHTGLIACEDKTNLIYKNTTSTTGIYTGNTTPTTDIYTSTTTPTTGIYTGTTTTTGIYTGTTTPTTGIYTGTTTSTTGIYTEPISLLNTIYTSSNQESTILKPSGSKSASCQVQTTIIDPTVAGNIGRYLNHSCEPNLRVVPVRIETFVPIAALFSTRDIRPGEELCYDYDSTAGFGVQGVREVPAPQNVFSSSKKCLCCSRKCRGYLSINKDIF